MIYTVTLNPAVDCTLKVKNYQKGRVNRAESQVLTPGGKGINMSIILSRLGIPTKALGFCGGDTGHLLCELLKREGCPHELTELDGQLTRINMKLSADNIETEINGKGPEISNDVLEQFIKKLTDVLEINDTLILAGSVPYSVPENIYADIMSRLYDRNIRVIADTSGKLLTELLEFSPFLIKPNNFELGEICDCEIKTHDEAYAGAIKLKQKGARNVLVSLAGEGAVLVTENGERIDMYAPDGIVLNSVGAGDSMVAGFLAGLELFGDFKTALSLGTACGSATAFSEHLAQAEQISYLFKKICPEKKISLK